MTNKYKVGQEVIISQIFEAKQHGQFVKCFPFIAIVVKVEHTPTYGYAYTLAADSKEFKVCYWEEDIDGPAVCNQDEEAMWVTWGDQ